MNPKHHAKGRECWILLPGGTTNMQVATLYSCCTEVCLSFFVIWWMRVFEILKVQMNEPFLRGWGCGGDAAVGGVGGVEGGGANQSIGGWWGGGGGGVATCQSKSCCELCVLQVVMSIQQRWQVYYCRWLLHSAVLRSWPDSVRLTCFCSAFLVFLMFL